jgi:hypothetical protein
VSTLAMEKIHSISICESGMPKIYCAKKSIFGNLASLTNHQIKGSRPSIFSTLNLRNKNSSTLKRFSIASCVEAINPNNLVEVEGSLNHGKIKPAT